MSIMLPVKILFLLFLKNELYLINCYVTNIQCLNKEACNFDNVKGCTDKIIGINEYDVSCICTDEYQGNTCNEVDKCYLKIGGHICRNLDHNAKCNPTTDGKLNCTCSDQTLFTGENCEFSNDYYNQASNLINSNERFEILKLSYEQSYIMDDAFPYFLAETKASNEELSKLSWDFDEFIIKSTFDRRPFDDKLYFKKTFDPALGNCYTFNHFEQKDLFRTFYRGVNYGLEVIFQLKANETLPWIKSSSVKIFIHNNNEVFTKKNINYKVGASKKSEVFIYLTENVKLPSPYSECVEKNKLFKNNFYFNGSFNENGCFISCYIDYMNKMCNCQDPTYGINKKINDYCFIKDRNCIENILKTKGDPVYWPECKCSVPCNYFDYQVALTSASFLKWMPECTAIDPMNMKPENNPDSVICQNMWNDRVWIQLTLANTVRTYTIEKSKQSISNFFTTLGALTGALIGLSIVTIFELIIFFLRLTRIL
ncbi:Na+ channel, amiloride-sensitive family-containing protein [Strongyloides ratti]|uniref:Na+ channel, amiloride-sensitive family-containing protein n=1 Tax=Strongyloides ratti TaxID=34506 RepID=A0A090LKC4_STRRB|nr:Na+ channel, amiloride-sensitive family-containing protein [Strongyloides ratti]CEF70158.1 Na+ channel, amiloride-sensitive family-containing protein [Strongyloides ratti]